MGNPLNERDRALIDAAIAAGKVTVCPPATHALWPKLDNTGSGRGVFFREQMQAQMKAKHRAAKLRAAEARENPESPADAAARISERNRKAAAAKNAEAALRARIKYTSACDGTRTMKEVAEHLGVTYEVARQAIKRYGLRGKVRKDIGHRDVSGLLARAKKNREDKAARYAPYLDGTRTIREIADALGVHYDIVHRYIRKHGLRHLTRRASDA